MCMPLSSVITEAKVNHVPFCVIYEGNPLILYNIGCVLCALFIPEEDLGGGFSSGGHHPLFFDVRFVLF